MNIFELNKNTKLQILPNEEILKNLDSFLTAEKFFISQGEEHEDIDIELVEEIDNLLIPIIGNYENTGEWYHSMLCNLDGIRALSLNLSHLSNKILLNLQGLLKNKTQEFCIFINVHNKFSDNTDNKIGTILILTNKVICAKEVANENT